MVFIALTNCMGSASGLPQQSSTVQVAKYRSNMRSSWAQLTTLVCSLAALLQASAQLGNLQPLNINTTGKGPLT